MKYANIKTPYGNRFFRSRIEAQHAALLDGLGVRFHYEPRSFDLGDCRYTPDFYLPNLGAFLEIKAGNFSAFHLAKIRRLCEVTRQRVFLFGEPDGMREKGDKCAYGAILQPDGGIQEDCLFAWGTCTECGQADITLISEDTGGFCGCSAYITHTSERLKSAYETASKRFLI